MSSLFSVARLLGKGRAAKRATATKSSATASVSTVDKLEKNDTPKSSTIALPLPIPQPPAAIQPASQTASAAAAPALASISESPKAGPYKELEPIPKRKASSTAETTSTLAEVESQPKIEPVQETGLAVVPTPAVAEIAEPAETLVQPTASVEEPGYDLVSQPVEPPKPEVVSQPAELEVQKAEVGWTEVESSPSSVAEVKQDNIIESSVVVPGDVSPASDNISNNNDVAPVAPTLDVPALTLAISQQDGALQTASDNEAAPSEVISGLKQKIEEVEAALNAARGELETKSRANDDLLVKIDVLQSNLIALEKSKEETLEEVRQEKNSLIEETHRLKGIIGVERLDNRERIDNLVMEKEAAEAKLEIQQERINRLEESLAEGRVEIEKVFARNRDLEGQLRRYEELVEKDEDDNTDLLAEKDQHIETLEKNNENLSSQLVQLQSSLNTAERQSRMFLDQLRKQSNELQLQLQARKTPLGRLGSTIWGMTGASRVESAIFTMKALNEDIFQTAAALTDQLENIPKVQRFVLVEDEGLSAKAEILKSMLGIELVKTLQEEADLSSEESNPLFVQIALQGCLTASCMRIITSWYPAEWEYGNLLVALYERIRGTGGPEIALNWKKATQQSCAPSTDRNAKLIAYLTEQVQTVLLVSGWTTESPVEELLKAKYSQNLAGIVFHALRLNGFTTATGDNRDVESFCIDAGNMFDPNRMTNDSPFDDLARESRMGSTPDEEVICTTALGLKSADIDPTKPDQILLKPKVFLHGGLL